MMPLNEYVWIILFIYIKLGIKLFQLSFVLLCPSLPVFKFLLHFDTFLFLSLYVNN